MTVRRTTPLPPPQAEHRYELRYVGGLAKGNVLTTSDSKGELEAIAQVKNYNHRRTNPRYVNPTLVIVIDRKEQS